jgi:hypothetical protein
MWAKPQIVKGILELEREYGDIVCYSEIRWLLNSLLLLLKELKNFPVENGKPVTHFEDANWACDLAFRQTAVGTRITYTETYNGNAK